MVSDEIRQQMTAAIGTPAYMAPEVIYIIFFYKKASN